MYISRVVSKRKKRKSYTSILLRESFRVGAKVKSRTLAILTKLPSHLVDLISKAIESPAVDSLDRLAHDSKGALRLRCGPSFGALWTVAQIGQRLGIDKALGVTHQAELGYWQVLSRVLKPAVSLLGMVRLAAGCAAASVLNWTQSFTEDHLYKNGSWLVGRQALIQRRLWEQRPEARQAGQLFLYDVTGSYLEGHNNVLGDWGYNRDGKKGKQQVVVGLLTDAVGEPCAVQVYQGNTSDLKTFAGQVQKVQKDFRCQGVTMVGDRGMIRSPQMADVHKAGFHYITALTKPQIEKLLKTGAFQMELFDEKVSEVQGEDSKRYVLRRNPVRAEELAANREAKKKSMLKRVEEANKYLKEHPRAAARTQKRNLTACLLKLKVNQWLAIKVQKRQVLLKEDPEALRQESELDGCYVIQSDLKKEDASAQALHDRYKDLAHVEQDFRTMKTGHLRFRPWFVQTEDNTRAHALTAMLALKIRRHLAQAWSHLNLTVEEGVSELEKLCVMELVDSKSGEVISRIVPEPNPEQKALLEALKLQLPEKIAKAKVKVGTRVKLQPNRKTL